MNQRNLEAPAQQVDAQQKAELGHRQALRQRFSAEAAQARSRELAERNTAMSALKEKINAEADQLAEAEQEQRLQEVEGEVTRQVEDAEKQKETAEQHKEECTKAVTATGELHVQATNTLTQEVNKSTVLQGEVASIRGSVQARTSKIVELQGLLSTYTTNAGKSPEAKKNLEGSIQGLAREIQALSQQNSAEMTQLRQKEQAYKVQLGKVEEAKIAVAQREKDWEDAKRNKQTAEIKVKELTDAFTAMQKRLEESKDTTKTAQERLMSIEKALNAAAEVHKRAEIVANQAAYAVLIQEVKVKQTDAFITSYTKQFQTNFTKYVTGKETPEQALAHAYKDTNEQGAQVQQEVQKTLVQKLDPTHRETLAADMTFMEQQDLQNKAIWSSVSRKVHKAGNLTEETAFQVGDKYYIVDTNNPVMPDGRLPMREVTKDAQGRVQYTSTLAYIPPAEAREAVFGGPDLQATKQAFVEKLGLHENSETYGLLLKRFDDPFAASPTELATLLNSPEQSERLAKFLRASQLEEQLRRQVDGYKEQLKEMTRQGVDVDTIRREKEKILFMEKTLGDKKMENYSLLDMMQSGDDILGRVKELQAGKKFQEIDEKYDQKMKEKAREEKFDRYNNTWIGKGLGMFGVELAHGATHENWGVRALTGLGVGVSSIVELPARSVFNVGATIGHGVAGVAGSSMNWGLGLIGKEPVFSGWNNRMEQTKAMWKEDELVQGVSALVGLGIDTGKAIIDIPYYNHYNTKLDNLSEAIAREKDPGVRRALEAEYKEYERKFTTVERDISANTMIGLGNVLRAIPKEGVETATMFEFAGGFVSLSKLTSVSRAVGQAGGSLRTTRQVGNALKTMDSVQVGLQNGSLSLLDATKQLNKIDIPALQIKASRMAEGYTGKFNQLKNAHEFQPTGNMLQRSWESVKRGTWDARRMKSLEKKQAYWDAQGESLGKHTEGIATALKQRVEAVDVSSLTRKPKRVLPKEVKKFVETTQRRLEELGQQKSVLDADHAVLKKKLEASNTRPDTPAELSRRTRLGRKIKEIEAKQEKLGKEINTRTETLKGLDDAYRELGGKLGIEMPETMVTQAKNIAERASAVQKQVTESLNDLLKTDSWMKEGDRHFLTKKLERGDYEGVQQKLGRILKKTEDVAQKKELENAQEVVKKAMDKKTKLRDRVGSSSLMEDTVLDVLATGGDDIVDLGLSYLSSYFSTPSLTSAATFAERFPRVEGALRTVSDKVYNIGHAGISRMVAPIQRYSEYRDTRIPLTLRWKEKFATKIELVADAVDNSTRRIDQVNLPEGGLLIDRSGKTYKVLKATEPGAQVQLQMLNRYGEPMGKVQEVSHWSVSRRFQSLNEDGLAAFKEQVKVPTIQSNAEVISRRGIQRTIDRNGYDLKELPIRDGKFTGEKMDYIGKEIVDAKGNVMRIMNIDKGTINVQSLDEAGNLIGRSKTLKLKDMREYRFFSEAENGLNPAEYAAYKQLRTEHISYERELYKNPEIKNGNYLGSKKLIEDINALAKPGEPVSIVFADLDNLNVINRVLGSDKADDFLRAVMEKMRSSLKADISIAPTGDEFVFLLKGKKSAEDLAKVRTEVMAASKQTLEELLPGTGISYEQLVAQGRFRKFLREVAQEPIGGNIGKKEWTTIKTWAKREFGEKWAEEQLLGAGNSFTTPEKKLIKAAYDRMNTNPEKYNVGGVTIGARSFDIPKEGLSGRQFGDLYRDVSEVQLKSASNGVAHADGLAPAIEHGSGNTPRHIFAKEVDAKMREVAQDPTDELRTQLHDLLLKDPSGSGALDSTAFHKRMKGESMSIFNEIQEGPVQVQTMEVNVYKGSSVNNYLGYSELDVYMKEVVYGALEDMAIQEKIPVEIGRTGGGQFTIAVQEKHVQRMQEMISELEVEAAKSWRAGKWKKHEKYVSAQNEARAGDMNDKLFVDKHTKLGGQELGQLSWKMTGDKPITFEPKAPKAQTPVTTPEPTLTSSQLPT